MAHHNGGITMDAFGLGGFATVQELDIELYTSAYRVSGTIHTPFRRVAEILNLLPGGHLAVDDATIAEHVAHSAPRRAASALVIVDEILVLLAPALVGDSSGEMRIRKRPVHAMLAIPPLSVEGTIHVPEGSLPVDGLLNVPDRFLAMTDATLSSAAHPELERRAPILALRRDRAHVIVVREGEEPAASADERESAEG
jgi:hypothetical protein